MAKANFLNQAESFMSESYISQIHDNAIRKPENEDTQGVMLIKIQEKN